MSGTRKGKLEGGMTRTEWYNGSGRHSDAHEAFRREVQGENIMLDNSGTIELEQTPSPFRPHVNALDGIRGLALLMVMATHLLMANQSTGNRFFDFISKACVAGWVGVDLFFVLSGFLITGILYDSVSTKGYFKNFYARRALRIFPLYYGFLLVLICLTVPMHLNWQGAQYKLLTYTQNLSFITKQYEGYAPSNYINLHHFWSLAVEEQFYLVWPFIVFFVRDIRKLILTAVALSAGAVLLRVAMMAHGISGDDIFIFTLCRADSLMTGGALALALRTGWRDRLLRYSGFVFFLLFSVLACIAGYMGNFNKTNPFVLSAGYTLVAFAFAALIGDAVARPLWTRLAFENSLMRFLGKYSYGIYIFHYSIDATLTPYLRRWLDATFHIKAIGVAGGGLIVGTVAVLAGVASFHLYEQPFLRLKRYFEPVIEHPKEADCFAS